MNQYRTLNKVFAALVFIIALATYMMTLQPSVPFWDCGEFAAAAMWQQVPHPPGAPLWLMAAKSFEDILPGDPGYNFNMFAAICSAFAALFTYLIAVNAVERFRPFKQNSSTASYITTYGAGLIGALAFIWSDSNWFNSVESEVYSAATLLAAVVMWLMMKWDQEAERKGHERWILLLSYVLGLSIGVHLLSMLVIPSIALTMYFRKVRKIEPIGLLLTLGIMAAVFALLYKSTLAWIPAILSESAMGGLAILAIIIGGMVWAFMEKKAIVFLAAASFTLVILGYTTYTQILVRSAAHPVMNENEPDTFDELRRYLGREQYGDRPHWPRRVEYHSWHANTMPKYGPATPPIDQDSDGNLIFGDIDAGAEFNYMFRYQIYTMYLRYLFWNFSGRVSDMQDAETTVWGNTTAEMERDFIRPTGADDVFPITFYAIPFLLGLLGIFVHFRRDWKMATIFMTAFLFLGVLAALQQRQQDPQPRERDYFYAGSFMIFSIWIGFGALGLAEAAGQKKRGDDEEEDGIEGGSPGGINPAIAGAVLGACLLAAPVNMAIGGWTLHDRSGNWLPWDYAYNILQSCDENAILFTNGDNDTFPLWYIQDVAGVRRDVRVVNLELAQTPWYIWQMKFEPTWDAPPVPMTFSEDQIADPDGDGRNSIGLAFGDKRTVPIPVPAHMMAWATNGADSSAGTMQWEYTPTGNYGGRQAFSPKNQIVQSILEQTAKEGWERPIYFSVTAGNEFAGLEPYVRGEGMAYRVMPVKQSGLKLDRDIMWKCLVETLPADESYTEQHYGFKFRGLNDPNAHFLGQDDHRRPVNYFYHSLYLQFAEQLLFMEGDSKGAVEVLNKMAEQISLEKFGPPIQYGETYSFLVKVATLYRDAGDIEKAKEYAQRALDLLNTLQARNFAPLLKQAEDHPLYVQGATSAILGDYGTAIGAYQELMAMSGQRDPILQIELQAAEIGQKIANGDAAGAQNDFRTLMNQLGPPTVDYRAQSLMRRFPTLSANSSADTNTGAEAISGEGTGE